MDGETNAARTADDWVLAGRYRMDAPIGSGGMGAVWRGYDPRLDRRVAIKLMHPQATASTRPGTSEAAALAQAAEIDRERFLREIRTTARLEHPGIPAVYDFGIDAASDRIYLVMQLLYGQTLAELVAARDHADPWPVSWAAAIAGQIAATLVEVHSVDVVHRDIKPSNLMVTSNGLVKILDFGVAVLQGASALPKLTQIGRTVGSPPYMSREQALGNPVGPPSDVYALGCVLHEMLTGRTPFVQTASRSYQDHHINTPPSSLLGLRAGIPVEMDALVLAMLAKEPGDRPDAESVYETLLAYAAGSGVAAGLESREPSADLAEGSRSAAGPLGSPTAGPLGSASGSVAASAAGPLWSASALGSTLEGSDPRRPFLRPMSPSPKTSRLGARPGARSGMLPGAAPSRRIGGSRVAAGHARPLSVAEFFDVRDQVAALIGEAQFQPAIDLLDDVLDRVESSGVDASVDASSKAAEAAEVVRQLHIDLGTALFLADEFTRAAAVLDQVAPAGPDDDPVLSYYAGVSHAEIGAAEAAIGYFRRFLASADVADPLYRDAKYQFGMLLAAVGRIDAGIAALAELRPILAATYGEDSVHVRTLDRRIADLRARLS